MQVPNPAYFPEIQQDRWGGHGAPIQQCHRGMVYLQASHVSIDHDRHQSAPCVPLYAPIAPTRRQDLPALASPR